MKIKIKNQWMRTKVVGLILLSLIQTIVFSIRHGRQVITINNTSQSSDDPQLLF